MRGAVGLPLPQAGNGVDKRHSADAAGKTTPWLFAVAIEMMCEPCAVEFVETIRDELDLEDPVDARELSQNRAAPPCSTSLRVHQHRQ